MANNIQIKPVNSNNEKNNTYRYQLGRYNKAIKEGFYFEAMMIVYAMLEDRLRSYMYYIGLLRKRTDFKCNKSTTEYIKKIMFEQGNENPILKINTITGKIQIVKSTLNWSQKEMESDDGYLKNLKLLLEGMDIDGFLEVLSKLDAEDGWLKLRNEIIHSSMNKNICNMYENLSEKVQIGFQYARFIDSQIKVIKKSNEVRKYLKLSNE